MIGVTLLLLLGFSSKSNFTGDDQSNDPPFKQKKVCFNDGYYTWNVTVKSTTTTDIYTCTGSVNVDGVDWPVYGKGVFPNRAGNVLLHATNPNPNSENNCDGPGGAYVDSFAYNGTAAVTGSGSTLAYSGFGTWVSYCGGSIFKTGTWTASGPCTDSFKALPGHGPAGSGSAALSKVVISPNPLRSSSTLTLNLAKESKVIITVYNSKLLPVKQVANKTESAGKHSYVIDGSALSDGVYRVITVINGKAYSSALQVVK